MADIRDIEALRDLIELVRHDAGHLRDYGRIADCDRAERTIDALIAEARASSGPPAQLDLGRIRGAGL